MRPDVPSDRFVPYDPAAFSAAKKYRASRGQCSRCDAPATRMRRCGVIVAGFCEDCAAAYEASPQRRRGRGRGRTAPPDAS